MRALWQRLLRIDARQALWQRRGFAPTTAALRERLERVGLTFLEGYHHALRERDPAALGGALDALPPARRGFAYEGAAMALALLDTLTPGPARRWRRFLDGPGAPHVYMLHVGLGWAMARIPFGRRRVLARLDPLLRWLALDGYGFHDGYFHPERCRRGWRPRFATGYRARAFDQGLGRSFWFSCGADVSRVAAAVAGLHPSRAADLWAGVGLAATYAAGADRAALAALAGAAGAHRLALAQGAAFAVAARVRARNLTPENDEACVALTGLTAELAARLTQDALIDLPAGDRSAGLPAGDRTAGLPAGDRSAGLPAGDQTAGLSPGDAAAVPAYEVWRVRIQAGLAAPTTAARAIS
jgi:hypothetical protein